MRMHVQFEEIKCRDVLLECAVMHDDILINNGIIFCMGDKPNEGV